MKEIISGEIVSLWEVRIATSSIGIYQSQKEAEASARVQELMGFPTTVKSFRGIKQDMSNGKYQFWKLEGPVTVQDSIVERALAKLTEEEKEALGLK